MISVHYKILGMTNNKMDFNAVYVLHTRPFRNTSLLVDLFTQTHGLVSVVARSARGPRSRYQGKLQPFTPMLATWVGRHELKTLNHLELNGLSFRLNQQPLFCAFYLNELLMRVLQKEDAYPQLFSCYHDTLVALEAADGLPGSLRRFEKHLLEALGYGLPLKADCQTGEPITTTAYYQYLPQQGFMRVDSGDTSIDFLGENLLAIAAEQFESEAVLQAAKRLMRLALSPLLGDRPLHSRALF